MIETKKEEKSLQVILTHDELLEKSRNLAKIQLDMKELENRLKDVKADFTAKIASAENNIGILSRAITNGYEYREVECEWTYDYSLGTKTCMRLDTFEIIKTEPIPAHERQAKLAE